MSNPVKQQKVKWKSYCENNELRDFEFGLVISKLGLAKIRVFFLNVWFKLQKEKKIASYSLFVNFIVLFVLFAVEMKVWYILEKLHILFRWWRNRMKSFFLFFLLKFSMCFVQIFGLNPEVGKKCWRKTYL